MANELYQKQIIELARESRKRARIDTPDTPTRFDNPLCGDRIDIDFSIEAIIANVYIFPPFQMQILVLAKISFLHKYSNENSHSTVYSLNAKRLRTYISIVVCLLSGRPPKGEVGIPWPQRLEFSLTSEGLAFSNALFPGQAWGTNLVLLPYAGGQA